MHPESSPVVNLWAILGATSQPNGVSLKEDNLRPFGLYYIRNSLYNGSSIVRISRAPF